MATYKEGDIYYNLRDDGKYHAFKILKIESPPPGYHIALYQPTLSEPSLQSMDGLKIAVMHLPVMELSDGIKFLANVPVEEHELEGYYKYLELSGA